MQKWQSWKGNFFVENKKVEQWNNAALSSQYKAYIADHVLLPRIIVQGKNDCARLESTREKLG